MKGAKDATRPPHTTSLFLPILSVRYPTGGWRAMRVRPRMKPRKPRTGRDAPMSRTKSDQKGETRNRMP